MMNYRNLFTILWAGVSLLFSCQNTNQNANQDIKDHSKNEASVNTGTSFIIGSWEDQSAKALNFTLYADGKAQSDNMATLLYQQWYVKGNQLFLVAKSIGNKHTSVDTIAYAIQKLNDSTLTLIRGDLILNYKKVNKNNATIQNEKKKSFSEEKSRTLKGQLTLGHEANVFKPYTPIFAAIEVIDNGKAKEGFPADYESTYEVVNVLETRNISGNDCE